MLITQKQEINPHDLSPVYIINALFRLFYTVPCTTIIRVVPLNNLSLRSLGPLPRGFKPQDLIHIRSAHLFALSGYIAEQVRTLRPFYNVS